MKALIAAGGRATRLRPITTTINKHLIPLVGKPMLFYAIEKIVEAGVTDIAINVNPGETEIQKRTGDGSRWGATITYIEQTGGPKGVANVIAAARDFLGSAPFIFYLGDNIILGSIRRLVEKFSGERRNALLALAKVRDPQRFGVPEIVSGNIVRVEEKPRQPKSEFAVTGIYLYDSNVFKAVESISPSARGEYEISDVHTWLIEHGYDVGHEEITGWWKDTGKPEDLLEGNMLLMSEMPESAMRIEGTVESGATIYGRAKIGKGTTISAGTVIRGPVVIGDNCTIASSFIGPYSCIGDDARVTNAEIEHSIIFDRVTIDGAGRITDSLIGSGACIAARSASKPAGNRLIIGDNSTVSL